MKLLLFISLFFQTFLFSQEDVSSSFSYIQLEYKTYTFDEIKEKSEQNLFLPLDKDHSKFGFTNDIFWIKAHIKNNTSTNREQILELNYPSLDAIDIYELNERKLDIKKKLGDLRPFSKSTFMPNPNYAFSLSPFEEKVFFIQIMSTGSLNIGISIQDINTYNFSSSSQIKWLSFYFGAVLMMLMYNFLIYLMTKNKSFLYYVLFHLSYLVFALGLSGVSFQLFWPENPNLNQYVIPMAMSLTGTFSLLFSIHFLELKLINRMLYKFLYALAAISFIISLVPLIHSYSLGTILGSLISFIIAIILFILSLYLGVFKKNINALFYFFAWSFFCIGVVIAHLSNIGIIPSTMLTNYSSQIGSFFEVLLLSIGLAYYYSRLKNEHTELTITNDQLRLLSNTDMLTKSYNRRYFYEIVTKELKIKEAQKRNIALLMIDLDHFKKINDAYGHDIGDKVLISFVQTCNQIMRKNDIFARIGGEEFVLYLPDTDDITAIEIAEKIKSNIEENEITFAEDLALTVSIGISRNTFKLSKLLKQADKALYKAKETGRNKCVLFD